MLTPEYFNEVSVEMLPGHLGIKITRIDKNGVRAEFEVKKHHLAPNGFLHAAILIALADTSCGNDCIANLPESVSGFTTEKIIALFRCTQMILYRILPV